MSGLIQGVVQGIGQDFLTEKATEYAETHFQRTKNPFYEEIRLPNGETKEIRLKLPKEYFTKNESKAWKSIQNKAWLHDRSLCGCCCWTDTIGWAPLLALLPVIGPIISYSIHNKLITLADKQFNLPMELKTKMHGNIVLDLCISLVPILGTLFSWLHTCSTRNAAMIYNFIVKRAMEQNNNKSNVHDGKPKVRGDDTRYNGGNNNNNIKERVRNDQKENYEMKNIDNVGNTGGIRAPQQARYIPTRPQPQQIHNRAPPPQQQSRYERGPMAPSQPPQYFQRSNKSKYYEPKRTNLPYPTDDTDFY